MTAPARHDLRLAMAPAAVVATSGFGGTHTGSIGTSLVTEGWQVTKALPKQLGADVGATAVFCCVVVVVPSQ